MATTTIPIDPKIRDRLRRFGHAGQTYNEIITAVLNRIERDEFVAEMRREKERLDREGGWIEIDDLDDL